MNYICIDLGGTRIKIGLLQEERIVDKRILYAQSNKGLASHLPLIDEAIAEMLQAQSISSVAGVSMAFPGLVNPCTKRVLFTTQKYDDAPALNLEAHYKAKWDASFFIENDARLACIGEWKYGAGKGTSDMVMCTLGTGVGSAAIINGKILRGRYFQAGILGGHSIIDFQNTQDKCSCGGYGCVEATASTWKINNLAENHPLFEKSMLSRAEKIDLALVLELSIQGDELAGILKEHCINVWSAGIINLIRAYDPEVVVIGGGIMHAADMLMPYFKKNITEKAWWPSRIPDIKRADFPDTAALLGAVTLFDNIIHE